MGKKGNRMNKSIIKVLFVLFLLSGCTTKTDTDDRLSAIEQQLAELNQKLEETSDQIAGIQVPDYVDPNTYMEGCYKTILQRFKDAEQLFYNSFGSGIFCCGSTNVSWASTESLTRVILLTMPYEVDFEGTFPEDFTVTEDTSYDLVFSYQNKPIISYLAYPNRYLELTKNTLPVFSLGNGFSVITILHDQSQWPEFDKTKVNDFINKLTLKLTEGRE